jgi:hypothetical protein
VVRRVGPVEQDYVDLRVQRFVHLNSCAALRLIAVGICGCAGRGFALLHVCRRSCTIATIVVRLRPRRILGIIS